LYAKLYSRITESSIIEEPVMTRWVFVGMLAISEVDGTVIGTDVAIARRLNVSIEDFQSALKILMSPDPKSNNMEYEGRRVIESPTERGYFLTSYEKYRTLQTKEMRREYMKEYMANKRLNQNVNKKVNKTLHVNSVKHAEGEAEAEVDSLIIDQNFEKFWIIYPRKVGKKKAFEAWIKINPSSELVEKMIKTISWQRDCQEWNKEEGKFIPHPTTWLNAGRWDDENPKDKPYEF